MTETSADAVFARMARRRPRRVVLLAGAGADSAALLVELLRRGFETHPLYVRSGLRWEAAELHWLKRLLTRLAGPRLRPLTVMDAPILPVLPRRHWSVSGAVPDWDSPDRSVGLPARNLTLAATAGLLCGARRASWIATAILKGNPFPDARPRALRAAAAAIGLALDRRVGIAAPYARLGKAQVRARVPETPWELTFSCLSPRGLRACGGCNKCAERARAGF